MTRPSVKGFEGIAEDDRSEFVRYCLEILQVAELFPGDGMKALNAACNLVMADRALMKRLSEKKSKLQNMQITLHDKTMTRTAK